MADRIRDSEDRRLEAMFEIAPIPDDGFSDRIVARIRRRLWVRRLAVPAAIAIGGLIAVRPAIELMSAVSKLLLSAQSGLAESLGAMPQALLPQLPAVIVGVLMVTTITLVVRALEE